MTSETNPNLIDAIIADHRWVERCFKELEDPSVDDQRRRDLVDHVIAELVRHSVAEEQYLYPAVREYVPGGQEIADHEIREHAEAEHIMKRLEGLEFNDPQFGLCVDELIHSIRHHVDEEESDLLPKLRDSCDTMALEELGGKLTRAKLIAPTRPHPNSPDRPPANLLVDAGEGLIDRLRDTIDHRRT